MSETYIIYSRNSIGGGPMVLGVQADAPLHVVQRAFDFTQSNQTWSLRPIPGTSFVFLRHEASGLYAMFPGFAGDQVTLAPLDPLALGFVCELQGTDSGYVAINTRMGFEVFDVAGNSRTDGAPIIAYAWNQGWNQQWLFAPPPG